MTRFITVQILAAVLLPPFLTGQKLRADTETEIRIAMAMTSVKSVAKAEPASPYRWLADVPGQLSLWRGEVQVGAYRVAEGVYQRLDGGRWTVAEPPVAVPRTSHGAYTSPPNFHRHVTVDGGILEHNDANFGSAPAHFDVQRPLVKYTGPASPTIRR